MKQLALRLALLCSVETTAVADDIEDQWRRAMQRQDRREAAQGASLRRVVLSARLCAYQRGLAAAQRGQYQGPDTARDLRRYISQARQQLAAQHIGPLSCRDRWVGAALMCLGSFLGADNLPADCSAAPYSALRDTDRELPSATAIEGTVASGPPRTTGSMVCRRLDPPLTGETCRYVGPPAPPP